MGSSLDSPGDRPEDDSMDGWRSKVEERLGALERDVAVIRSNYVTKADLQALEAKILKGMNVQTWRFVTFVTGVAALLVSATYFIATQVR